MDETDSSRLSLAPLEDYELFLVSIVPESTSRAPVGRFTSKTCLLLQTSGYRTWPTDRLRGSNED